jgi:hypothetical protein
MEHLSHGNLPQQDNHPGVDDFDLTPKPVAVAGSQLVVTRLPIIPRTAFDAIGDKYPTPLQTASLEKPVEKLPGTPTEWASLLIFKLTGCLADEENWRMRRAFARHCLVSAFMKRAPDTAADIGAKPC